MIQRSDDAVIAILRDYKRGTGTIAEYASKHAISTGTLDTWIKKSGLPRRVGERNRRDWSKIIDKL